MQITESGRSPLESFYNCHGVGICISGNPVAAEIIHRRLKHFSVPSDGASDVVFEFCNGKDTSRIEVPLGQVRPIYELQRGTVLYEDAMDRIHADYDRCVSVHCEPRVGRVRLSILEPDNQRWQVAMQPLFMVALLELLKRRRRYSLHAAGLCSNGKGLLLAGVSGSGKTTLAMVLLSAGFDFLGDDLVFLAPGEDEVRVYAFPDQLGITERTVGFFPELAHLLSQLPSNGKLKREVDVHEVSGTRIVWSCPSSVVVFPRIANARKSVLTRMGGAEALMELIPNVLLTEATSSQAHMDILGRLARENRCYRLDTGTDFDDIPKLLQDVLAQ